MDISNTPNTLINNNSIQYIMQGYSQLDQRVDFETESIGGLRLTLVEKYQR